MTNKAKWRQVVEERNKALNLLREVLSYVTQGVSVPKTLVEDCERLQQGEARNISLNVSILPLRGNYGDIALKGALSNDK